MNKEHVLAQKEVLTPIEYEHYIKPVSYTHLDVYKRQVSNV